MQIVYDGVKRSEKIILATYIGKHLMKKRHFTRSGENVLWSVQHDGGRKVHWSPRVWTDKDVEQPDDQIITIQYVAKPSYCPG